MRTRSCTVTFADLPEEVVRHIGGMLTPSEVARGLLTVNRDLCRIFQPDLEAARQRLLAQLWKPGPLECLWSFRKVRTWAYAHIWYAVEYSMLDSPRKFHIDFIADEEAVTITWGTKGQPGGLPWLVDFSVPFRPVFDPHLDYHLLHKLSTFVGDGDEAESNLLGAVFFCFQLAWMHEVRHPRPHAALAGPPRPTRAPFAASDGPEGPAHPPGGHERRRVALRRPAPPDHHPEPPGGPGPPRRHPAAFVAVGSVT